MATPVLYTQPQNFNFSPGIIPPSPGDLEEARIRRSMDLAKLRELTLAPGFEQQRLNLAGQAQTNEQKYRTGVLSETSAHNVAEENHWSQMLGLDKAKLDETTREHNAALSELGDYHKGVLKNQITDSLITHFAQQYQLPEFAPVFRELLNKRGVGELSAAHEMVQQQKVEGADKKFTELKTLRSKGVDIAPMLESIKTTQPDLHSLLQIKLATEAMSGVTKPKASKLTRALTSVTLPGLWDILHENSTAAIPTTTSSIAPTPTIPTQLVTPDPMKARIQQLLTEPAIIPDSTFMKKQAQTTQALWDKHRKLLLQ